MSTGYKTPKMKRVAAGEDAPLYARMGIESLFEAIDVVVRCGCPEWLWRESVREHVKTEVSR